MPYDVVNLTRQLVDIPSVTEDESAAAAFVEQILIDLGGRFDGRVEKQWLSPERFNLLASFGSCPTVTFSTHIDTVPPFFGSSEDEYYVYGRGACDAKGILASMLVSLESLLTDGVRGVGLLVVVGEERGSAGAIAAANLDCGARYLINGEPTENKLAIGTKGALRLEIETKGKMAHSAYPELGESAIEKLLLALHLIKQLRLPQDPVLGDTTLNIGVISGGRAPNIIPDYAKAELLIRLVGDDQEVRTLIATAIEGLAEVRVVLCIPAVHLTSVPGFETVVVKYTTDIPALGPYWGKPLLLGPGSIHVAHTMEERVSKSELTEAVALYTNLVKCLASEEIR